MSLITLTSCRFAFLVAGLVWTLCLPLPVAAQGTNSRVTCASDNGQRVNCNANTQGGVRLVRQISGSACQEGSTWGYDSRGIWVDRGCRAEFEILGGGSGRFGTYGSQQGEQRRAQITAGGNSDRGKCTVEVVVDGVAEVEIRGDSGVLRHISGQTPQWRRFECTGPMPASAADFRFAGVDGRGRQQLVGDPRNGGVAVVRIEDPQSGSEGYTFDLTWSGGSGYNTDSGIGSGFGRGGDRRNEPSADRYSQSNGQFSNDALRACEDAVRQQATQRFNTSNITFQRSGLDGNQGRRDLVTGTFSIRRGAYGQDETHRFSCALNLNNGSVGSVQIDPTQDGNYAPNYGNPNSSANSQSMQQCERAIQDRIRRDGYESVEIQSMNADNRSGRGDSIVGNARAARRNGFDSFDFTCVVNANNGSIRSVDVRRR